MGATAVKIAVCIKRTPDSESRFKIVASGIAVGPDAVQESLRKAMSMGADRAVQLKTDTTPADGIAVAKALAAELKDGGYDLILFGKQAFDTSAGVVGTAVAELLGLPCVTAASQLDVTPGKGTARRELKGIMAAKKKPLELKPAQLGPVRVTVQKMELPPERPAGRIIGEGVAAVP